MDIPSPVRSLIFNWMNEFHRVDAIERVATGRQHFADHIRTLCADIRANPPVYTYTIDSQYSMSVSLPACNPNSEIPWRRRALSISKQTLHT